MGSIFLFMSLNSLGSSAEFSQPVKETLTKAQKAVIDRVLSILEQDPTLKEKLNKAFEQNLQDIVNDEGKFNLLLEKIGATEMNQLWEIQSRFEKKEITGEWAIEESKMVIKKYTTMKLSALKSNITPDQA